MGILSIIKSQWDTIYDYVLKNIKFEDIANFKKIIGEIYDTCQTAKNNKTCLGDCIHCEHLAKKIKEFSKEDKKTLKED